MRDARFPTVIHDAAAVGFARSADAYERSRPGYPEQAIAHLLARLPARAAVLDLAAGTGKLTRPLLDAGLAVTAVEPVAQMRAALPAAARPVAGTAEAIPLEDRSVDAVTVGQAFHWFDGDAALAEIHRVLRPDGLLAVVWNRRRPDPVNRALDRLLAPYREGVPTHSSDAWRGAFERTALFGPLEERTFGNQQELDADGLEARVASISSSPRSSPGNVRACWSGPVAWPASGPSPCLRLRGARLPREVTERAVRAAVAVATAHGLEVTEPRLVRDLSNVLVHLAPAPVVARVATSIAAARPDGARAWLERDVRVATHLAARGAAVVAPAAELPPGPHTEDGFVLTFWRLVDPAPERPAAGATGRALRELHGRLDGFPGGLRTKARAHRALAELPPLAAVLDEAQALLERCSLADLHRPLQAARAAIERSGLPRRPLHGDAHAGNLLRTPDGLLWTDFEDACAGPLERDLACLTFSSEDAAAALGAYGYEGTQVTLAPFVEARAVQGVAWTALMAEHHPQLRARVEERMSRWRGA